MANLMLGVGIGSLMMQRAGGGGIAAAANRIVQDVAWSWHLEPGIVAANNEILVGSAAAVEFIDDAGTVAGAQYFLRFDPASGEYLGRVRYGSHTVAYTGAGDTYDDHNAPVAALNSAGNLVAAGTGHNDVSTIWVARSTDADPANLSATTTIATDDPVTYVQLFFIGSTGYLFARQPTGAWSVWTNADDGDPADWVSGGDVLTSAGQAYIRAVLQGGTFKGLAWDHPVNTGTYRGDIRYIEIDPASISAQALADLPALYNPGGSASSRVLSINDDMTQFFYVRFTVGTHTGQTYWLARLTGSDRATPADWTHESLGETTESSFWEPSHYVAGGELIGSGATATALWLARDAGDGTHRLEHWSRATSGDAWTVTPIVSSSRILARPLQPRGGSAFAVVQEIDRYTDFTDFKMRALSIPNVGASNFSAVPFDTASAGIAFSEGAYSDAPDTQDQNITVDLSDAVEGDVVAVAVLGRYPATGGSAPAVTIGGVAGTLRASQLLESGGTQTYVAAVYTATVPSGGVTNTINIDSTSSGGVMSYQIAGAHVMRGVTATPHDAEAFSTSAGAINTAAAGFIFGGCLTGGDVAAPHEYTGATRLSLTTLGSNTRYSFGADDTAAATASVLDVTDGSALRVAAFASFARAV